MFTTIIAAAALAAQPVPDRIVSMTIDRTDLETAQGRQDVYGRVKRLARRTCRVGATTGQTYKLKKICAAEMTGELVAGIGDYRLTALHEGAAASFAAKP